MPEHSEHHSLLYRRIALPLLALLRMGTTPEKLAWSLAAGVAAGICPLPGSTTIFCFAFILLFRLNLVAGQIANHSMYPAQIALMFPFIRAGEYLFHTGPLPIAIKDVLPMARTAPYATVRLLWLWEWHAMVAWAIVCAVLTPLLALALTPVLRHTMAYRERQKQKLTTD
ncbi:MAG TPA: DUF2062 domain-containing protein [Acidobacteriaceae bacterium]|nr:DUF2062 domain-containing protein [Acidobacteriaceae bacterium]